MLEVLDVILVFIDVHSEKVPRTMPPRGLECSPWGIGTGHLQLPKGREGHLLERVSVQKPGFCPNTMNHAPGRTEST